MSKTRITTSAEVYAVLRARHAGDMLAFGSYSAPEGEHHHPGIGRMHTAWGLRGADHPLISIETEWDILHDGKRGRATSRYFLHIARNEE
ncbi:MAG: hypothetical protein NUV51_09990 [Sulfuricaulis sp.]|nr:hypothetical protein [Sulfuricaulis sp.]